MGQKDATQKIEEPYNITVKGRHVAVTDAMKDYALEKLSKIERLTHRIIDLVLTMDIQKLEHKVTIVLKFDHTKIKAEAVTDDMYASIDKAVHKLEAQVLKYKTKLQDYHHRRGMGEEVMMNVDILRPAEEELLLELNEDIESESLKNDQCKYQPHQLVKRETRPLKMLNYKEAMVKMDLSGDVFMIFKSEEDKKVKVIYRRKDDNYAIIEPEQ